MTKETLKMTNECTPLWAILDPLKTWLMNTSERYDQMEPENTTDEAFNDGVSYGLDKTYRHIREILWTVMPDQAPKWDN